MANGVTELLNVPGGDGSLTIEFNGKKYTAGLITQKVKSGYEKIMEKKALDSIFKMKEFLDPVEFREAVSSVTRDIASGVYSFGSDRSIQSLSTPGGTITFSALVFNAPEAEIEQMMMAETERYSVVMDIVREKSYPNLKKVGGVHP
jgi:hypothetical protein